MGVGASSTYTLGKYVFFARTKVKKLYNAEMFFLATLMMTFTS